MIRYALHCDQGHAFESWFQSSAAYDKQAKRALVTCPTCGSAKVEKAIMAPRLARAEGEEKPRMMLGRSVEIVQVLGVFGRIPQNFGLGWRGLDEFGKLRGQVGIAR